MITIPYNVDKLLRVEFSRPVHLGFLLRPHSCDTIKCRLKRRNMKRKAEDDLRANGSPTTKRRAITDDWARSNFRGGLFDIEQLSAQTQEYSTSQP